MKSGNQKYHFAVFGDIHGRIALMYTLAYLWENESGIKLSGLLQVGDMGAFPNPFKLDDATQKYAENDPDELGFHKFCTQTEESEFYLARQNTPNTYFIRGNHEDFDYLDSFSMPETVDPWQRLHFIPDGQQITLFKHRITIGGFSGIPPSTEQRARGKKARKKYRKAHRHVNIDRRFFSSVKAKSAFNKSEKIDILMTHAGPQCPDLQCGSIYLTELAKRIRPKVHLFGHHHQVIGPCQGPGNSLLVGLEHLDFNKNGELKEGAWGILTLSGDSANFTSPKNLPFLKTVKRDTYRSLLN
jgi:predicted phosphohydrolase